MKVVVIGCTHAGTFAIINTRKAHPEAEIVVYEKNDNISFLSCGIALHVGGVVDDAKKLFYSSPEELAKLGVSTNMEHDVLGVDFKNKILNIKDLKTGEEKQDSYDKLIIASGSWPIVPPIDGIKNENILLCKNYNHAKAIIEKSETAKKVTVIGAGYIGVELAEAFEMKGKEVTIIDALPRVLAKYLDKDFTDIATKSFEDNGVKVALEQCVNKFESIDDKVSKVITDKGEYETDLVVLCIGFKPNTLIFKDKLECLENGAIKVNEYMQTSEKDVFAAGDCCSVKYNPLDEDRYIPLATNAIRMGTLAAINLKENKIPAIGTQGTSGIKIYDYNFSSTGLTESCAIENGIKVKTISIEENNRPEFMPDFSPVKLKIVYAEDNHRLLGAQITSKLDLTQTMQTMSVCIQNKMTVEELAFVDFFFMPHFNKPWNILNTIALESL